MEKELSQDDLVWGANGIAKVIGRTDRQTFHMLDAGALPAKKVGGRWVASKRKLLAFLIDEAAGERKRSGSGCHRSGPRLKHEDTQMNDRQNNTNDPGQAIAGLREALFHIEAAAEILRQNTPHGFEIHIQEIFQDGTPMLEKLVVQVLDFEEASREYGPISGRSIRHSWREIWNGPVA